MRNITYTLMLMPMLTLFILIPVLIGVYVYRDAARRGMNAVLWTLIAVLAPTFIGFIVYLVVRGGYSDMRCPGCAAVVSEQYTVCPKCGARLKAACPNCGFPAEADWTVCPKCATALSGQQYGFEPPHRPTDRTLWKILIAVLLIPILLIGLLLVVNVASFTRASSMRTVKLNTADYAAQPEVSAWLAECDADNASAYALRYREEYDGRKITHYLVYRPTAYESGSANASSSGGLFQLNAELRYNDVGEPNAPRSELICITGYADKFMGLKVFVNGERTDCRISEAGFNPEVLLAGD